METDLDVIFQKLKTLLQEYKDPLTPKFDEDGKYDLWSFKDLEIAGRKRKEVNFATIITHSKHVGLYYMPIYTDTDNRRGERGENLRLRHRTWRSYCRNNGDFSGTFLVGLRK